MMRFYTLWQHEWDRQGVERGGAQGGSGRIDQMKALLGQQQEGQRMGRCEEQLSKKRAMELFEEGLGEVQN